MTPEWERDARAYEAGRQIQRHEWRTTYVNCEQCDLLIATWVVMDDGEIYEVCDDCYAEEFEGNCDFARPVDESDGFDAAADAAEQRRERD